MTATRRARGRPSRSSRIVGAATPLVLVDATGTLVDRYDKHALLPLAERLPLEDAAPWLRRAPSPSRGPSPPAPTYRRLAGQRHVAPLICFEAVPSWPARHALASEVTSTC
ncbi:MAG: hypothetical protein KIT58_07295 [Planctomycetota bacterium]|nr:hypothetical protein [Planctomycetota bacterium]